MVMEEGTPLLKAAAGIKDHLAQSGLEAEILCTRIENTGGAERYLQQAEIAKGARF